MQGKFEVNEACYPYGYLRATGGRYVITNMVTLDPVCGITLHGADAEAIAARANKRLRGGESKQHIEAAIIEEINDLMFKEAQNG